MFTNGFSATHVYGLLLEMRGEGDWRTGPDHPGHFYLHKVEEPETAHQSQAAVTTGPDPP